MDALGTDLYVDPATGDLVVDEETGDLKTVSGLECLRQNLGTAFGCGYGEWGMELLAGSGVAAAVEMTGPYFEPTVRGKVREVCRRDGRVDMDALTFEFEYGEDDGAYAKGQVALVANDGPTDQLVLPLPERSEET